MRTATTAKTWGKAENMLMVIFLMLLCIFAFTGKAHPADFSTAMAKTMAEIPFGADVAGMGNTSTATPDFSSRNPAVMAVESADPWNFGFSTTGGLIHFKSGSTISLYSLSGTAKLPVGILQITVSDAKSNTGTLIDESAKIKFNNNPSFDVQYGLATGKNLLLDEDALYLGASYGYSQSKLTGKYFIGTEDTTMIFDFKTESKSHNVGVGALYQIAKVVNLGATFDHSWDSAEDFINGEFDAKTKSQSNKLRLGVGVQVLPMTFVAADYQHLYLSDGLSDDQYFAGVEQYLVKDILAVYAGYANGGATAGLGIYLKHGGINIAYMNRGFRSMDQFLGKSEMAMLSIYGNF